MKIEVSNGEVLDRWTILTIKRDRIQSKEAQVNIQAEISVLMEHVRVVHTNLTWKLTKELYEVNCSLWDVEDKLRQMEADQSFGEEFIEAARSVYLLNDDRARIKRRINGLTGSILVEEKSYTTYEEPSDG